MSDPVVTVERLREIRARWVELMASRRVAVRTARFRGVTRPRRKVYP